MNVKISRSSRKIRSGSSVNCATSGKAKPMVNSCSFGLSTCGSTAWHGCATCWGVGCSSHFPNYLEYLPSEGAKCRCIGRVCCAYCIVTDAAVGPCFHPIRTNPLGPLSKALQHWLITDACLSAKLASFAANGNGKIFNRLIFILLCSVR